MVEPARGVMTTLGEGANNRERCTQISRSGAGWADTGAVAL